MESVEEDYRQFATVLEVEDGSAVVHVFGDVDLSCASELEAALDQAGATPGVPIVVDLQECRYMDSTGLTALIRAVKQYGPRVKAIVTEHSVIARLMEIAGFEKVLPITFTRDLALVRPLRSR